VKLSHDPWYFLREYTHARIALGRSGHGLPTREILEFRLAHSRARDSVWSHLDLERLKTDLKLKPQPALEVRSKCTSKKDFLLNPNHGRQLDQASQTALQNVASKDNPPDVVLILADGLSANGIQVNAPLFVQEFLAAIKSTSLKIGPIVIAQYARVALGDDIAAKLNAKASIMLIGERPGLASSESLSVYFTYAPNTDRNDADRNCISNIHSSGLSPHAAAHMAIFLLQTSMQKQLSGVSLKFEYPDFSQLLPHSSLPKKTKL